MAILRAPVRIDFDHAGSPGYNIWHIRLADGTITPTAKDNAISALVTFYTSLKPLYHSGTTVTVPNELYTVGETDVQDVPVTRTAVAGTGTTEAPHMLALCLTWKTSVRSRSGRGRTFIGPLADSVLDPSDGAPTAAARTVLLNAATALISSSDNANEWAIGVYSRQEGLIRDIIGRSNTDTFAIMSSRRD